MDTEIRRRRLLGIATVAAVAGCLDADDSTESNGEAQAEAEANGGEATEADEENGSENGSEASGDDPADEGAGDDESTVHEGYETTEVRVLTDGGDELGAVTAAIADTDELRYLGLSATEELPSDRGMLFVYESVDDREFVMREMDFGIDIVYADADGTITGIHHAPEPGPDEDGNEQRYPGRGQYVLEVNYEWTAERGVSEGDRLSFELPG